MRKEYDFSRGKRGAVISSPGKTRVTLMLDDDVVEAFRARAGSVRGFQILVNEALRRSLREDHGPQTAKVVPEIFREELTRARHRGVE